MNGPEGDITLAFELSALRALADPSAVFTDARQWSAYVGVISDEPTYVVTNYTRKRRIRQDFFSGPKGKTESLASVKQQFDTDRHIFVGTSESDREIADDTGWEYLSVEDAAAAAEWEVGPEDADAPPRAEEDTRDDWP